MARFMRAMAMGGPAAALRRGPVTDLAPRPAPTRLAIPIS